MNRFKKAAAVLWDVLYPMAFLLICLVLVTAAVLMIAAGILKMLPTEDILGRVPVLSLVVSIGFYGITILTQRRVYRRDDYRFGERKNHWNAGYILAAAVAVAAIGWGLNMLILFSPLPVIFPGYTESAAASFGGQPWPVLILATVVLGPAAEELIFRGLTYSRLKSYVPVPWAVVISSLLFGLYHGNMIQFIYTTIMGLFLAFIYEKSGGLPACIIAHMALNAVAVTAYL